MNPQAVHSTRSIQNGRLFQIRAARKGDTNARFTRRIAPSHITQLEALTMWCHSSVPQTNCIRTVREYHRMISATETAAEGQGRCRFARRTESRTNPIDGSVWAAGRRGYFMGPLAAMLSTSCWLLRSLRSPRPHPGSRCRLPKPTNSVVLSPSAGAAGRVSALSSLVSSSFETRRADISRTRTAKRR